VGILLSAIDSYRFRRAVSDGHPFLPRGTADAVLFCRMEKKDGINAVFLLRVGTFPHVLELPILIAKIQFLPKSGQTARFSVASRQSVEFPFPIMPLDKSFLSDAFEVILCVSQNCLKNYMKMVSQMSQFE
jgi:hypothetical protein